MLQHAEELRLALATAAREVGDLQQQAALAAAAAEGPLAAALQAACRDAAQWREQAEGRVGAARQAEEGLRREASKLQQRAVASQAVAAAQLQHVLGTLVEGIQAAVDVVGAAGNDSSSAGQSPIALAAAAAAAPTQAAAGHVAAPLFGIGLQQRDQHALPAQRAQQRQEQSDAWESSPPPLPAMHTMQPPAAASSAPHLLSGGTTSGLGTGLLQQGPAAAVSQWDAPRPPSRTASDILAAYRARQQHRSASSGGAAALGLGGPSCGASRETSSSEEAGSDGQQATGAGPAGDAEAAAPAYDGTGYSPAATVAAAMATGAAGTAAADAADGNSFYVSDLTTSEDSSRF